jgi:galactokinase
LSRLTARAPGRVNLIGEHTDYNEGFVMPAAIGYETRVEATGTSGREISIRSQTLGQTARFDLDALPERRHDDWSDYARGVIAELHAAGVTLKACDLIVTTALPLGGGLSSSASFEVAVALALLGMAGREMPPLDLARLAQRAESLHAGTHSGIMDQFVVAFGRPQCLVLLDTRSLAYEYLPLPSDVRLVLCNTTIKHTLASSAYNERRRQCERAVELLRRWYPDVEALRDVTIGQLETHEAGLPETLFRRARHVVTENARVLSAKAALLAADLPLLGALMSASHASLRDDYAVSCAELETMIDIANGCEGVYGARMTGGGFGGCTVNLVAAERAAAFGERIARDYAARTGLVPEIYDGTPVAGAEYAS